MEKRRIAPFMGLLCHFWNTTRDLLLAVLVGILVIAFFSFTINTDVTENTFQVRKRKYIVIEPTKMNVLYIGIDNPLLIGTTDNSTIGSISIANGSLTGSNGEYIARVTGGASAEIYVSRGKKEIEKRTFRIKRIPDPISKFGGIKGSGILRKENLVNIPGVIAELENFDFDLSFRIHSFDITISNGCERTCSSRSALITPEQKQLLTMVKPGNKLWVENIKAVGPDGTLRNLSPILIKVI